MVNKLNDLNSHSSQQLRQPSQVNPAQKLLNKKSFSKLTDSVTQALGLNKQTQLQMKDVNSGNINLEESAPSSNQNSQKVVADTTDAMDDLQRFVEKGNSITSYAHRNKIVIQSDNGHIPEFKGLENSGTSHIDEADMKAMKRNFRNASINGSEVIRPTQDIPLSKIFPQQSRDILDMFKTGLQKNIDAKETILQVARSGDWKDGIALNSDPHILRNLTTALKGLTQFQSQVNLPENYDSKNFSSHVNNAINTLNSIVDKSKALYSHEIGKEVIGKFKVQAWGDLPQGARGPFAPDKINSWRSENNLEKEFHEVLIKVGSIQKDIDNLLGLLKISD